MRTRSRVDRRGAVRASVALLTGVVLTLSAACSSSGGGSGDSGGSNGPATAATTGPGLSGAPIKVGLMYTDDNALGNSPEIRDAGLAAQSYVNAHGGFDGRPLQLVTCNGKNNPANDAECAQQFVNSKVITVLGLDGVWGSAGVPIINRAGILNQTLAISGPEYSSPNAYPFNGELIAAGNAIADYAAENGVKSVACIYAEVASLEQSCKEYIGKNLQAKGITVTQIPVPVTTTDMGQYAQKLAQTKADLVAPVSGVPFTTALITAAQQNGYNPKWFVPGTNATPDFFKALGSGANGMDFYMDYKAPTDTSDPNTQIFLNAMKQYQPKAEVDTAAVEAFSNVMTLQTIAKQIGAQKMTSAGLKEAIKNANNLPQFMGAPLNANQHLPGLPNCLGVSSYFYTYQDGKYVPVGKGLYS